MEAPDKIYLPKEEIEERMPWITEQYPCERWDECYIRKDALLEHLEEWLEGAQLEYHRILIEGLIKAINLI